jgi:hypothetical protein
MQLVKRSRFITSAWLIGGRGRWPQQRDAGYNER